MNQRPMFEVQYLVVDCPSRAMPYSTFCTCIFICIPWQSSKNTAGRSAKYLVATDKRGGRRRHPYKWLNRFKCFQSIFSTSIQILLGRCSRSNTWWQQTKGGRGRPPWASFTHQIISQPLFEAFFCPFSQIWMNTVDIVWLKWSRKFADHKFPFCWK